MTFTVYIEADKAVMLEAKDWEIIDGYVYFRNKDSFPKRNIAVFSMDNIYGFTEQNNGSM